MSDIQLVQCDWINRSNVYKGISEFHTVSKGIKHWENKLCEDDSEETNQLIFPVIKALAKGYVVELVVENNLYSYQPDNKRPVGIVHINHDNPENDHVWQDPNCT